VRTIVGEGLFEFGDHDGTGARVRLQHCLGLAYADGRLYIADTYNNRVKVCTPQARSVKSLVGAHKPGESDDPPHFYQPGGLSVAGSNLYVADTNNHKVRVVDLKTTQVKSLELAGLAPPRPAVRPPSFPNARTIQVPPVEARPGDTLRLAIAIPLAKGLKLNEEFPMPYLVETPGKRGVLSAEVSPGGGRVKPPAQEFPITLPLAKAAAAGDSLDLRVSVSTFVCNEKSSLCQIRSFIWDVPVKFGPGGTAAPIRLSAETQ
jgi:hypothetical protein